MNYAIVLAGGKGTRMNSDIPKQFLTIGGKPLISYSLDVFEKSPLIDAVIIVTSQDYTSYMKDLVKENDYKKIAGIALGGKERYDSVYSGLQLIQSLGGSGVKQLSGDKEQLDNVKGYCQMSGEDYIFIHDGARPCITAQIISNCMQDVIKYKACVAAVPVKDTIKVADKAGMSVNTPDRSTLWQIQTPQVFEASLIKEAYDRLYNDTTASSITDDAMVVERYMDRTVKMTMADYKNIKVTTPEDMDIAGIFLKA